MQCAIAKIDPQSRERLCALQKTAKRLGFSVGNLYGHITLAVYVGDQDDAFIASCKRIASCYKPFDVCYDQIEVLSATSIIVASPRNENELLNLHHDIAAQWGACLDRWTGTDLWKPHTTLVYNPQIDLRPAAEAMKKEFVPFPARVETIEFSRVTGNGCQIVDCIGLLP